jgi:hypothetical protein
MSAEADDDFVRRDDVILAQPITKDVRPPEPKLGDAGPPTSCGVPFYPGSRVAI